MGKITQVYPPKLVSAILQGLRAQLRLDWTLSNLEEKATGPVCEEPNPTFADENGDSFEFDYSSAELIDDVSGGQLDPMLVKEARAEELEWMKARNVFEIEKSDVCWQKTRAAPLSLPWVDTNKGSASRPRKTSTAHRQTHAYLRVRAKIFLKNEQF